MSDTVCAQCGGELPAKAGFCPWCGATQADAAPVSVGATVRLQSPPSLRQGICPRCQSSVIYADHMLDGALHQASTNAALLRQPAALTIGFLMENEVRAALISYVCGACGYLEQYVRDDHDQSFIRMNWWRVR